jgi:hypothetical protein
MALSVEVLFYLHVRDACGMKRFVPFDGLEKDREMQVKV